MEDDMPDGWSPKREIPSAEENMPPEAMDENSNSSDSSRSNSEMTVSDRSSCNILYRITKEINLSEPKVSITGCPNLYLISTRLETVPANQDSWTNTRRFMSCGQNNEYICRIPKRLVINGKIRQTLKFVSMNTLLNLRMKLQLMYGNRIIDEWQFVKGVVFRDEITRWETTINRSPNSYYFDPTILASTLLKTEFYDGDQLLHMYYTCIIFT